MKKFFLYLVLVSAPLLATLSFAEQAVVPTAEQELAARLKAIVTFSAEFEQRITDKSGNEIQLSQGRASVKHPGKFHWQINPPWEQLVVSNGQTLWVYDADLEQVTLIEKQQMDDTPAQILSGNFASLQGSFDVQSLQQKDFTVFKMSAKDAAQASFAQLEFVFGKEGELKTMLLIDKLDQMTRVSFRNQVLNQPIDDKLFTFEPPPGVDVIVSK